MRRAVATLVTVAVAGGMLTAAVWIGARDEPEAPRPTGAAIARTEPAAALVCEEAPRNPQIAANEAWPRSFAGYWIDEGERTFYVAFTEGAAEKVARLTECFPERTFAPVTFERSLQEMEAVLDEMLADREAIRGGTLELPGIPDHRYSFGIEVMRNAITVYMEDVTPEVMETFKSRYGSFLEVVEVEGMGPD